MTDILKINEDVVPKFPKHVKFKYNKARKEWVILAPEDSLNLMILQLKFCKLIDGKKSEDYSKRT